MGVCDSGTTSRGIFHLSYMASFPVLGRKTKMKINQNKEGKEKEIKKPG
jgi:hypothetical protein